MNTRYHKFLIIFAVILLLGGVYLYFENSMKVEADTQPISNSSLVSSSGGTSAKNVLGGSEDPSFDKILEDTSFLATLTSLTKIKIDTSLFSSPTFRSLNDNTVVLEPSPTGRSNPFAPVAQAPSTTKSPAKAVITNVPTQITTKSAVLNGAISGDVSGVTSTYFEYGSTPSLGKSTLPAKQSLIGTFVTSINGLNSGSTYFFRAAARIAGTLTYGEIVSFNTN